MKKCTLQLEELICPMCSTKVETAIKNTSGVAAVTILFNASKAKVEFDEAVVTAEEIAESVRKIGYEVLSVK